MDNVTLPGSGSVVATDDLGGAHHQYVKVEYGADGVATPVTESTPMPVLDDAAVNLLRVLVNLLMSPQAFDSALNRYRETTIIESGTVTTVGTVSTITNPVPVGNVASVDGRNGAMMVNAMDHTAWALNVRSCIT